ncbi:uncharacterized protein EV420DRAFT_1486406 [Desarmillaria tabescens]|uniref:Uncharacterized protein n=1 Tax=Armillaria tabescens TaxID=1929756 RepID=A0AA39JAM3_ARMTA|nr:uncharacterized protein EV420DRAFT_1486406 [Desarmillaria tabescens]KAK0439267.1 hypothetical protein EV420DRAFT_1486406 [Desarmillaria tabescens]
MLTKYSIEQIIKSPHTTVLCLSAIEKGQFLASRDVTLHGYLICWKQIKNINVHKVATQMKLHGHISIIIQNCDLRAICFLPNEESQNIIMFGCHSGKIGHAAVNTAKDVFGIDDPSQGIALYHVVDGAKIVMSGSDHGIIYVFERRDGSVSKLTTEDTAWVQTLHKAAIVQYFTVCAGLHLVIN